MMSTGWGISLGACLRDSVVIVSKCPLLDELINGCEPAPLILSLIVDDCFKDF